MKPKKKDLQVDYIGGQGSLTLAEEEAITKYLTKGKVTSGKSKKQLTSTPQHATKANR